MWGQTRRRHTLRKKCFIAAEFNGKNINNSVVKSFYGKFIEINYSDGSLHPNMKLFFVDFLYGLHYRKSYNLIFTTINQQAEQVCGTTIAYWELSRTFLLSITWWRDRGQWNRTSRSLHYVTDVSSLQTVVGGSVLGIVGCIALLYSHQSGLCGGDPLRVRWRHWNTSCGALSGKTKCRGQIGFTAGPFLNKKGAPPRFVIASMFQSCLWEFAKPLDPGCTTTRR